MSRNGGESDDEDDDEAAISGEASHSAVVEVRAF